MMRLTDTPDFIDFHNRVGAGTEYVVYNNNPGSDHDLYLFENGARCCPLSRFGAGPPEDPAALFKARKAFYRIRLEKTKANFETRRDNMEAEAQRCAQTGDWLPFGQEDIDRLKEFKTLLDRYQKEYDEFIEPERQAEAEKAREENERKSRVIDQAAKALRELQRM